jgi:putative MATE family efflux protein
VDLTSGDIGRPLVYLAAPIVVTNLMQTAYNLADTFWLGRYSTEALAAISFAYPMYFLLFSLAMGFSVTGSVLVAQYTGADEQREAEYAASQTIVFSALASLVLGAVSYFLVGDLLALMGASGEVLRGATAYMQVISVGLVFTFLFWLFIALMRGYGDTVTPMLIMLGTVVANIVLDPFLIFGWAGFPELGVEGAAIATVLTRGLAMMGGLVIMFRGTRSVRIRLRDMRPDASYLRRVLDIGGPATVEITGRAVSVNLMLFIVGLFSTSVVAAFGVGVRVFSLVFLPAIAVDRSVETMTGQNIGAGKLDRVEHTNHFAARMSFVVLAGVGVVVFALAGPIIALFTSDAQVIAHGTTFLRWVAPTFGFLGVVRAYSGGFRGTGHTLVAAAIAVLMLGVVRLPLAWGLSQFAGETGIWISFAVSNVVGGTLAYLWFVRGSWRHGLDVTEVTEQASPSND